MATTTTTTTSTTLPPSTACLKTTVVNTSGAARYFDFIPPYGAQLDANQEFTDFGTPMDWIAQQGDAGTREALLLSFDYALVNNLISIKATPTQVVFDAVAARSRTLNASNGKLRMGDPCWDGSGNQIQIGPA